MMEPSCNIFVVAWCFLLFLIHAILLMSPTVESITSTTKESPNATDALALLAFKQRSDPFHSLSTWNDSLPFCQWQGITCSRRHPLRVVAMNLTGLQLAGPLSPFIANLTFLREIDLSRNKLHGQIPQEFGRLFRLRYLYLYENSLQGEIPANLSHCLRLRVINFDTNALIGRIPVELGSLSRLDTLFLGGNNVTGTIPTSFGNLSSLVNFSLAGNRLEGNIPKELGQMRSLVVLKIHENMLSGTVPPTLYNLSSLAIFSVVANQLSGSLSPSLGVTLPNLVGLYAGENRFTGTIPISLSNASRLEELDIGTNHFTGSIPMNLGRLGSLRLLNLEDNLLGNVEAEDMSPLSSLANCGSLEILSLSINRLRGVLPSSIANFSTNLQRLYLADNQIFGSIPSGMGNLVNLILLTMASNFMTDMIPKGIGKLNKLQVLDFHNNNLSGEVPQEGIFNNTRAISVTGNKRLCGGSPALLLSTCPSKDNKKQRRRFSSRRMVAILIGSILCSVVLLSLIYYYRRRSKKHTHRLPIADTLEKKLLRISYEHLYKATDGFSLTNLIGVGSYGSVYKGTLDRIGKIVAVKVLNLQRRGASKSFIAECKALRNVRHRNLLKVLTVCSSIDSKGDDFKALVFNYMANGNLERWLHPSMDEQHQPKYLSLIQRLNIAVDVASALNYLHNSCKKPIVHCDLKPSNILLDDDMNAQVGDFGLARFLSEVTSSCSQNQMSSTGIKGTIGYVPPEYGTGSGVSTFGDIYSYGIFLLEMFTGKKPTDEIFNENLSLHQFAKLALPERVMEIVDQRLLSVEAEALNESQPPTNAETKLEMCLISTFKVGVACCVVSIKDRMAIGDAMVEMQRIRNSYLGVGIQAGNN